MERDKTNELEIGMLTNFLNNYNTPPPVIIHSTSWSTLPVNSLLPSPGALSSSPADTSPEVSHATSSSSLRVHSPVANYDSSSSVSGADRENNQQQHDLQHEHNLQLQLSADFVEPTAAAPPVPNTHAEPLVPLPSHPMIIRGKVGIFKPRTFASQVQFELVITELISIAEAIKHPEYCRVLFV
uniref:Uncharacterized protein n=1 Tax=Cannabis sativa TaxID=3483 RepID=A0A803PDU6_CANSA